ncbi:MAG: energy-dependent translational throttle protein EttA [Planctomycetes bacterium]|nr:energy-dependent translational throttle protein EttA [Planctomycetota bacterium]
MSEKFVFSCRELCKNYGEKAILKDINLSFFAGAKIGIVGENGAGKSTMLKIMAGLDEKIDGYAAPAKGVRVGYVPQEPILEKGMSVRDNLKLAFTDINRKLDRFDEISELLGGDLDPDQMEKLMAEMAEIQDEMDLCNGWELDRQIDLAADALFLPDDDIDAGTLSGGEARRVFLCKTLLEKPELLLLDEPTNHLDAETVYWLENHLREYEGTVIIVTHDRYFLDNITKWILEIDRCKGIPYEGNYSSWLEQKAVRLEHEGKKAASHKKVLDRELEWIRSSPSGRRSKNKARIKDYHDKSQQNFNLDESSMEIQIPPGPALGNNVIQANKLSKSFGDNVIFKDFDLDIPPGAIVGIIGPNGAGKTTLFRMIMGEEQPDSGELVIGDTVKLSYVDQSRDSLNGENSIYDEIREGKDYIELDKREIHARAYVSRFNFKGHEQGKKVDNLSGGERNRVHLAKLLKRGGNVILLDEPTNDLDTGTLRFLEEGLMNFRSCALVISHDRFFLDRICTHLLAFEGNGEVRWFEGGFAEYEMVKEREAGKQLFENRRAKYKKLHL